MVITMKKSVLLTGRLLTAAATLIGTIGAPLLWRASEPEGIISMARDTRDFTYILILFPLLSLIFGLAASLTASGSRIWAGVLLALFLLFGGIGLQISGIMDGIWILLDLPAWLIGFGIGQLIRLARKQTTQNKEN